MSAISIRRSPYALIALVAIAGALPAAAQTPAAVPSSGFQDGFFVQSADGDNRLTIGLVAQLDGRFALTDPSPIVDTFTTRKVRPTLTGRVGRYFDFKVMPDFGNGTTVVQDAYFDIRFSKAFRVRSGKDKTPVGYEVLIGDAYLLFPERALVSTLIPNRDVGVQVQGDPTPKVFYAAGVFNGVPDGSSATTDIDSNGGKDLAGRVVVQPFKRADHPGPANGLGFQVGATTGSQAGALPSFRTSVQQVYFTYAAGATASGRRSRVSPAVFYYYKAFGGFAEYARSSQRVARGATTADLANQAWEVTGSYLLTGEGASERIIRPASPFDPAKRKWGALQLLARVSRLTIDDDAFRLGLATATASRTARQFTVAANWYPISYIKYYLTYERTSFDASSARPTEHVVLFRAQLGF